MAILFGIKYINNYKVTRAANEGFCVPAWLSDWSSEQEWNCTLMLVYDENVKNIASFYMIYYDDYHVWVSYQDLW